MANYNTFIVVDCKNNKSILTTSSARKAFNELMVGKRIDVWNDNSKKETIYFRNKEDIQKYIKLEKKYIMLKQKKAEERNARRREVRYG